jgi:hypothetical protein
MVQLCHFRIDLARHLHLLLGVFPLAQLYALKLTLAMKHVKTHGDQGDGHVLSFLDLGVTRRIGSRHPLLKPPAPISNDVRKTGPLLNHLAPARPAAIWSSLARHPP